MRRGLALSFLSLALLLATQASALPPDRWDRARQPGLARAEDLVEAARVLITEASASRRDRVLSSRLAGHAKTILDNLGARSSPYAERRYLFGEALALLGEDSEVIQVLEGALELAPRHPMAPHAAFELAIAYARAARPGDEVGAWTRYLSLEPSPSGRHLALYNRAEAYLRLGDMDRAEEDYRAALRLRDDALARYGLAITLDRSSRFSDAMSEARRAVAADYSFAPFATRLLSDGVFFVPDYERHWYLALRELGLAAAATEARVGAGGVLAPLAGVEWSARAAHLGRATLELSQWLAKAPSSDPWVRLARSRVKLLQAMTKAAEVEAKKRARPGGVARRR